MAERFLFTGITLNLRPTTSPLPLPAGRLVPSPKEREARQ